MKFRSRMILMGLIGVTTLASWFSAPVQAQWPYGAPTNPDAQRNALRSLQAQMDWFQNATRSAPSYGAQGYGNVMQNFQALRDAYNGLKQTLSPQQLANGANALAELDAGLDIIAEAFTYYQEDVAAGQDPTSALRNMCRVLRQASYVWLQELNKTCNRIRVGWN